MTNKERLASTISFSLRIILVTWMLVFLIALIKEPKSGNANNQAIEGQFEKTLKEDSLCRVWVYDTATRNAFKHWYNKQLKRK